MKAWLFTLTCLVCFACKKDEPIPTPLDIPPYSTENTVGVYRVKVIRIDFDTAHSYYSFPPDTTLRIDMEDDNSLGVRAYNTYYSVHYQDANQSDPNDIYYQIEDYSTNFAVSLTLQKNDPDSIYFYYSYYTPPMSGYKYIFAGRKEPF